MDIYTRSERLKSLRRFLVFSSIACIILAIYVHESLGQAKARDAEILGDTNTKITDESQNTSQGSSSDQDLAAPVESSGGQDSQNISGQGQSDTQNAGVKKSGTKDNPVPHSKSTDKGEKNSSSKQKSDADSQEDKIYVHLIINTGEKNYTYQERIRKNATVLELLQKASAWEKFSLVYQDSAYGVFIESIQGVKNDGPKNLYWMFKVNGKMASVGASSYKLKDKDTVEWDFMDTSNMF